MQWIARFCFLYGCAGTAATVAWCVYSLSAGIVLHAGMIYGLVLSWFCVFSLTFPRGGLFPPHGIITSRRYLLDPLRFEPVVAVTPRRIRIARGLLVGLTAHALLWTCVTAMLSTPQTADRNMILVLASFAALNQAYFAIHWGFRPQHLFADTRFEGVLGRGWRDRLRHEALMVRRSEQQRAFARLAGIVGKKVAGEKVYGLSNDTQRRKDSSSSRES